MDLHIKTIATGSTGNCYHLKHGKDELLIECGIPLKKIKEALKFKLSRVSGCICTHSHGDHVGGATGLMRAGVDCYMTKPTAYAKRLTGHRCHIIEPLGGFTVGNFTIMPFETEHDCEGCVGFLIAIDKEKILFATDTAFIRNRFKGLTRIMVECNYDEHTIESNVGSGSLNKLQGDRVLATHFGLGNVVEFLNETNLSKVKSIHLIHLSNGNANEKLIRKTVENATGKLVIIP